MNDGAVKFMTCRGCGKQYRCTHPGVCSPCDACGGPLRSSANVMINCTSIGNAIGIGTSGAGELIVDGFTAIDTPIAIDNDPRTKLTVVRSTQRSTKRSKKTKRRKKKR